MTTGCDIIRLARHFCHQIKKISGGIAHFFTLSAGIANVQYTKEPSPPDRKLAEPVLIYSAKYHNQAKVML